MVSVRRGEEDERSGGRRSQAAKLESQNGHLTIALTRGLPRIHGGKQREVVFLGGETWELEVEEPTAVLTLAGSG